MYKLRNILEYGARICPWEHIDSLIAVNLCDSGLKEAFKTFIGEQTV